MPFVFNSKRSLGLGAAAGAILRPQDVFNTALFSNGVGATTGVDLTQGGLLWLKNRSSAINHILSSKTRTFDKFTNSNTTSAEGSGLALTVTSTSFSGSFSSEPWVAWSFRKAANFYTEVIYTGDGTDGRQIAHDLGIAPGMVAIKRLDTTSPWSVFHTSATGDLFLNTTAAQTASRSNISATSATTFTVSSNANVNASGGTFLARIWGHDPDTTNGIIQCGSFTTDANGNATVTLGWRPQFVIVKATVGSSWYILDTSRGWGAGNDAILLPNQTLVEQSQDIGTTTSNGFTYGPDSASTQYVYLAIRSPT